MTRVCRPGGKICCMVYNRSSIYALQGWLFYGFLRGKPFLSVDQIAAEHFESPGTCLFEEAELRQLFGGLANVQISYEVTPYDLRIGRRTFLPAFVRRLVPDRFGYFMVLEGSRPSVA